MAVLSRALIRGSYLIDGTPVLDVKPHVRLFDAPGGTLEPDCVGRLLEGDF